MTLAIQAKCREFATTMNNKSSTVTYSVTVKQGLLRVETFDWLLKFHKLNILKQSYRLNKHNRKTQA